VKFVAGVRVSADGHHRHRSVWAVDPRAVLLLVQFPALFAQSAAQCGNGVEPPSYAGRDYRMKLGAVPSTDFAGAERPLEDFD
jgi:hypothetical protein